MSLSYLHGNLSIIDQDLSSQEIGADGSLVACTELLVDLRAQTQYQHRNNSVEIGWESAYILVHQAGLADTAIAQDDNLIFAFVSIIKLPEKSWRYFGHLAP